MVEITEQEGGPIKLSSRLSPTFGPHRPWGVVLALPDESRAVDRPHAFSFGEGCCAERNNRPARPRVLSRTCFAPVLSPALRFATWRMHRSVTMQLTLAFASLL